MPLSSQSEINYIEHFCVILAAKAAPVKGAPWVKWGWVDFQTRRKNIKKTEKFGDFEPHKPFSDNQSRNPPLRLIDINRFPQRFFCLQPKFNSFLDCKHFRWGVCPWSPMQTLLDLRVYNRRFSQPLEASRLLVLIHQSLQASLIQSHST